MQVCCNFEANAGKHLAFDSEVLIGIILNPRLHTSLIIDRIIETDRH